MKILSMEAEFYADGERDGHDEANNCVHKFAKAPKNRHVCHWLEISASEFAPIPEYQG
jgi:hypothetical protein